MNYTSTRNELESALQAAGIELKGLTCRCPDPQHEDKHASAGIFEGDDGKWRVKCASCGGRWDTQDLLGGNGRSQAPGDTKSKTQSLMTREEVYGFLLKLGTVETVDVYRNAEGEPLLYEARIKTENGKTFRPFHPVGDKFRLGECLKPWPILNQREILNAPTVVVCEGPKAANALTAMGMVSTTSPFGAPGVTQAGVVAESKAKHSDWTPLAEKRVILWPDNDAAGLRHMQDISEILTRLNCKLCTLVVAHLPPKEDAADLTGDEIIVMLDNAVFETGTTRLSSRIEEIKEGKMKPCPSPWPRFSRVLQAFRPGSVTLIYGPGGSRKSFLMLHLLRHLVHEGVGAAYLALEMSREDYIDRLLAQELSMPELLDLDWKNKEENWPTLDQVVSENAEFVDKFDNVIQFISGPMVTLDQAFKWVESQRDETKVIIIDPVSLLTSSKPIWDAHKEFSYNLTRFAQRTLKTIIIINHTTRDGKFMAGGNSLNSHTDATYRIKSYTEGKATVRGVGGIKEEVSVNTELHIDKGRHATLSYCSFGFEILPDSLTFVEKGIMVKE